MDGNYRSLTSLTANVKWDKTNANLGDTDTRTGSVSFLPKSKKHGMYIRLDWDKPQESMVVIDKKYQLYRPALNQVIQGSTDSAASSGKAGNAFAFLSMSRRELIENYDIKYMGQEDIPGGIATWHLFMTPKAKASYKSAELWVDKDGMPRQARINESNNDTSVILLSNIKKNPTIKADIFKLDTKGAKVVEG
ncbi:MAG: outer membrane lipoprotein-sorting protein [Acidobacteria bacterium OLB17]|nr:MAG: outer membrane lipoprotein-sorting protein [Acidobacteria bacterium OLB17]